MSTPLQHTSLGELGGYNPLLATSLGEIGAAAVVVSAFTYRRLLQETRAHLQDTRAERYTDAMLLDTLNRALNDLNRIRPDAWYSYYGQYTDGVPEITDFTDLEPGQVNWDDPFQPGLQFYPPVVQYVAGMIAAMEDERIRSGEVATRLTWFRTLVLNV